MIILNEIETLDMLKSKGSFKKVQATLNEFVPIKARGWKHLWQKITVLRHCADHNDITQASLFFKINDLELVKKYLWMIVATRRRYNLYVSSKYENIDYFKSTEVRREI